MPSKNRIKQYLENGYYHIYNRGTEKRTIFLDSQDYSVFLNYLKEYLIPKDVEELQRILSSTESSYKEKGKALKLLRLNNFADQIKLLAYCLMPNHFHLLIQQRDSGTIDKFMNSLATRYTMYFNKKYQRVGSLYQDVYKAVLISSDEQLLHLTRYIHKQALASQGQALQTQQPCSYPDYLGNRETLWIHPEDILTFFSTTYPSLSYPTFISQSDDYPLSDVVTLEES